MYAIYAEGKEAGLLQGVWKNHQNISEVIQLTFDGSMDGWAIKLINVRDCIANNFESHYQPNGIILDTPQKDNTYEQIKKMLLNLACRSSFLYKALSMLYQLAVDLTSRTNPPRFWNERVAGQVCPCPR